MLSVQFKILLIFPVGRYFETRGKIPAFFQNESSSVIFNLSWGLQVFKMIKLLLIKIGFSTSCLTSLRDVSASGTEKSTIACLEWKDKIQE